MNEWYRLIYIHFVSGQYVCDIRGVVEDLIGSDYEFYVFDRVEEWK